MERWCGKVAVVTGASSGIGACTVKKLVKCGVIVVGLARRVDAIETLCKELKGCKGKLYARKCDMAKPQEIADTFKWVCSNVGCIQILVNNAGYLTTTSVADGNIDEWKSMFDINTLAPAIAAKEMLKMCKEKKLEGHIVNINSIAGSRIVPLAHMYGPSKCALACYTEVLRHEITSCKLNVKVTSIHPGTVETAMIKSDPKFDTALKTSPKLGPDDVSNAVCYALGTPQNVQITQLTIQALHEAY